MQPKEAERKQGGQCEKNTEIEEEGRKKERECKALLNCCIVGQKFCIKTC